MLDFPVEFGGEMLFEAEKLSLRVKIWYSKCVLSTILFRFYTISIL